mmetsp:Transcript_2795/g.5004  ORF Transcript_2795/g.5004 Transcript_2795/m.5004 type:complete len:203 (-) Transcript_2795:1440-2048(-)
MDTSCGPPLVMEPTRSTDRLTMSSTSTLTPPTRTRPLFRLTLLVVSTGLPLATATVSSTSPPTLASLGPRSPITSGAGTGVRIRASSTLPRLLVVVLASSSLSLSPSAPPSPASSATLTFCTRTAFSTPSTRATAARSTSGSVSTSVLPLPRPSLAAPLRVSMRAVTPSSTRLRERRSSTCSTTTLTGDTLTLPPLSPTSSR